MSSQNMQRISARLRRCFVVHPQVQMVLARMEQLAKHQTAVGEEPEHLMLLGDTGVGKTSLLQRFLRDHPLVEHEEATEIPVLWLEVPARCTIKKLASEMLRQMGSEFWNKGGEEDRIFQLTVVLRACKVRVIVLDEVNHLVDRGAAKTHYAVADWIKQLGRHVSIVMSGIPRAALLLDTNEQLRDRMEVHCLAPFSFAEGEREVFRSTIGAFASLLEDVDSIQLTSDATLQKIGFATAGRFRPIRKLLVRAVELAFQSHGKPTLSNQVLSRAFLEVVFPKAPPARNPFDAKFNGLPLIRAGEPFAAGGL